MFPALTTQRFLLRKIVAADHSKVFKALSHPEVIRYYGVSYQTPEAAQDQMNWYQSLLDNNTGVWWAINHRQYPDSLIGACGFNYWQHQHKKIELGYWLLPENWKKGIMTECLPVIIQYAFSKMDIHRIEAVVESGNSNSSKLLTQLGFNYEGTHRDSELKNGRFIDLDYYALLNKK